MSNSQPILYETEYNMANVQVTPEIVEEIKIHDSLCECVSCNKCKPNIQIIKGDVDAYIQKMKQERDAYIKKMKEEQEAYIQKFKQEMNDIILLKDKYNEKNMKEETDRKVKEETDRKVKEEIKQVE